MSETPETPVTEEEPAAETKRMPPRNAKEKKPSSRRRSTAKERKPAEAAESKEAAEGQETLSEAEAAVARAEQKVDQWGYEIGRWASRLVARAREEAEDIVAEAQHLRKNGRS